MAKKKRYQWNEDDAQTTDAYVYGTADADAGADSADTSWQSRSQKKRDSTALQKLGEELIALPLGQIKKLPLMPELLEALELMARIRDHEGRRRQKQYIGKLMRECDAELVREALRKLQQGHTKETALFHRAERLRTALLDSSPTEQSRIITALSPTEDSAAQLRVLVHKAGHDSAAKRALFRTLRERLQLKETPVKAKPLTE